MKNKALVIATACALISSPAFAATDTSGMRYTSASEGFYASIRVRYATASSDATDADQGVFNNDGTRVGIRGTNDLGGGLEGFYRWEVGVPISDGDSSGIDTRLGNVGLRGDFGQVQLGSFWTQDYNWVGAHTDYAGAGNFYYSTDREGRSENAVEYTTPNINNFQAAIRLRASDASNGEAIDLWNIAGTYSIQGVKIGASWNTVVGGLSGPGTAAGGMMPLTTVTDSVTMTTMVSEDAVSWTVGGGYSQDNWYVGGLYGVTGSSETDIYDQDGGTTDAPANVVDVDNESFSVGGGVHLDKLELNGTYEVITTAKNIEQTYGGFGATYRFTAQSRVQATYKLRDQGAANPDAKDNIEFVLRHDF